MWENFDFEIWAMKLGLLLYLVAIPATALAQGSIAGRVSDAAGPLTGVAVEAKLRDAAPGVVVRGTIGRAWADGAVRGRTSIERQAGRWWP